MKIEFLSWSIQDTKKTIKKSHTDLSKDWCGRGSELSELSLQQPPGSERFGDCQGSMGSNPASTRINYGDTDELPEARQ